MAQPTEAGKPARKNRLGQFKEVFALAKSGDPSIAWKLIAIVVGTVAVGVAIGWPFTMPVYGGFMALFVGVLLAMLLLGKTAEKAAFGQLEGRPGAVGAVLGTLRRGWSYSQEPIAVEASRSGSPYDAALVYRAVGRAGVVLVGEGPLGRSQKLLQAQRRQVQRIVPNVPVTTLRVGQGTEADIVSPKGLLGAMRKLPKAITKSEVTAVDQRLRSLTGVKSPIPPGVDPQRMRNVKPPRR